MQYGVLRSAMVTNGVTIEEVSTITGLHRNTISNKLKGNTSFTIEEAFLIKEKFFPSYELGTLFRRGIDFFGPPEVG